MPERQNTLALVVVQACVTFFFDSLRRVRQAITEVLSERSIVIQFYFTSVVQFLSTAALACQEGISLPVRALLLLSLKHFGAARHALKVHPWKRPNNSDWFEVNLPHYEDAAFKRTLRVSRETFTVLADLLGPQMERQDTQMRKAIKGEKKVAIGLYWYGHGCTYFNLSEKFGIGESTAHEIVAEFTSAIHRNLGHFLQFPIGDQMAEVSRKFEAYRGLPNCVGALDCSHVDITAPACLRDDFEMARSPATAKEYFNRKGSHSVILQAVADIDGRFMQTYAGQPGSVHDARVLSKSALGRKLQSADFLQRPVIDVSNTMIKPYLLGDAGYALSANIIVPYPGERLTPEQEHFNFVHSSTRMCVERAFGMLKMRWRVLNGKVYIKDPYIMGLYTSCACILHNLMVARNDAFNAMPIDVMPQVPVHDPGVMEGGSELGSAVRDALCDYLWKRRQAT